MSEIFEAARRGLPLSNVKIIDAHCHMGPYMAFYIPDPSPAGMLRVMDRVGIDMACVTPHMAACGSDYVMGNDEVLAAMRAYPDRFLGYCTVNPNYPREMQGELERCFAQRGFVGIKIHPFCHGVTIDYPHYRTAYEFANRHRLPILFHTGGNADVNFIDKTAGEYPDARFIMGHAGFNVRSQELAMQVVNRHENVYVDIAISFTYECNVEWMVEQVGAKKVLYGSDMPFFDPRPAVGRVALAALPDDQKADLFYNNFHSLIAHRL